MKLFFIFVVTSVVILVAFLLLQDKITNHYFESDKTLNTSISSTTGTVEDINNIGEKSGFVKARSNADLGENSFDYELKSGSLTIKRFGKLFGVKILSKDESESLDLLQFKNGEEESDLPDLKDFIFVFADVNFDGIDDIGVIDSVGSSDVNYFYNFYKGNKDGTFDLDNKIINAISNPAISLHSKTVRSEYRSGPQWFNQDFVFRDGGYVPLEEKEIEEKI